MMSGRPFSRRQLVLGGATGAGLWLMGCSGDDDATSAVAASGGTQADTSAATGSDTTGPAAGSVPRPLDMVRTSWSTDPWALGSYSFLPPGATPDHRAQLTLPVEARLFFAGEALAADNPSTVHGARASGEIAAEQVLSVGASSVIVVGAGASGLRTAALLHELGLAVTVVEARERIGGRLDTVRPDGWPIPVERGASWVHDLDASDLADRLAELGVATVPFEYSTVTVGPDGTRVDDAEELTGPAFEAIEAAVEWAEDADEDLSYLDALADSGELDDLDPIALTLVDRNEVATEFGASLDELSVWWGMEEGSEGDDVLVTGGYGALADADADGLDVRLAWPVVSVDLTAGSVEVGSAGGETIEADAVVVTVPLGVLKAGSITFQPELPEAHQRAIDALGMGLLDKVWLRFEQQWWTEPAQMWTIAAAPDELAFTEWFNLAAVTGEPVLLGLIASHTARELATVSDEAVLAAAMESLQRLADAGW